MIPIRVVRNITFLFIIFFIIENGYTQVSADSLRLIWENTTAVDSLRFKAINKYYLTNTYAQPDSVLLLTNYHYGLAEERNVIGEMSRALNERSYAYYLKGNYKKSEKTLYEAIALVEDLEDPIRLARLYSNLGNIYGEQNKYQDAVRYFTLTLELFQAEGIEKGEARILHNLGLLYVLLDNYELALDYLDKSITINQRLGRLDKTGASFLSIGEVYYDQGKYRLAIEKLDESLVILIENNDKYSEADCYFHLAKSYQKLNNQAKAFSYLEKSLEIDYEIKNSANIIERLTLKAELTYDNDVEKATNEAEAILELINEDTRNDLKANLFELLYKCYKSENKYGKSLEMHEKHLIYKDSAQVEKNNLAIVEEAIKNEFDEKLLQNKIDNEKTQAALELNHLNRTYVIILSSAIIIGLIIFFFRKHLLANRKKRELLLEELEHLKNAQESTLVTSSNKFELNREKIEQGIKRKVNETDWNVLSILEEDPVISNKEIAERTFMSVDGIGSSLRRMYEYFEIKESKYKKISLLMEAIKISNNPT